MTRTMRFVLDARTALIAGVLLTFAAGLGWKVLSLQLVKAGGLLPWFRECLSRGWPL